MNNQTIYITAGALQFKGKTLDDLLAKGYYRMQHLMFTCNDTPVSMDGSSIPVFWLRTLVQKCRLQKAANAIMKKCAGFTVIIKPACVDDETETLYALYKSYVLFTVSPTCHSYLHQEVLPNPFDAMMVQVYDKKQLIAVGYFDKGMHAIAGIMNMYHPKYNKYSLGKFMMLQKWQYARANKMKYYYTGYISTGSTRFDYKTFPDPDAVEVFLPLEQKWTAYNVLGKTFLADYYFKFLV
jgi:arginine-tRNA-protein transferase